MDTEDIFVLTTGYRARMANEFIITGSDCMDQGLKEKSKATPGTSGEKTANRR